MGARARAISVLSDRLRCAPPPTRATSRTPTRDLPRAPNRRGAPGALFNDHAAMASAQSHDPLDHAAIARASPPFPRCPPSCPPSPGGRRPG